MTIGDFTGMFSGVLTGRQLLSFIAQLAGGFAVNVYDNGSKIDIINYATYSSSILPSVYKEIYFSDYDLPVIDAVIIAQEDGDIGHRYGSGDNVLAIYGNLLATTISDSDLDSICQSLYTLYQSYTFISPGELKLFKDTNFASFGAVILTVLTSDASTLYLLPEEVK